MSAATAGVIVVWAALGFITYVIARDRGLASPGTWFVIGVLLGPLGILGAFLVKPQAPAGQMASQWPGATPTANQSPAASASHGAAPTCPKCGQIAWPGSRQCSSCGQALT